MHTGWVSTTYDALCLLSFGGPEGPGDVMPFLRNVTAGRNVPDERLAVVAEQYEQFGGRSPINDQNRALIDALRAEFDANGIELPIYFGNRNWEPYLPDTVQQMADDALTRLQAILVIMVEVSVGTKENVDPATVDQPRQFGRLRQRAERECDRPDASRGEEGDDPIGAVGQEEPDPGPLRRPGGEEPPGQDTRPPIQLRIGEALGSGHDSFGRPVAGPKPPNHGPHRALGRQFRTLF